MRNHSVLLVGMLLCWAAPLLAGDFSISPAREGRGPERIGPPVHYRLDLLRYSAPDPEKSPIPQPPVTREDYYQWLVDSGHFDYGASPQNHGRYGPRHFMPLLAKYVHDSDPAAAQACIAMLKVFHEALQAEVKANGYVELFIDEPVYIGLYRRYLTQGGLLDPDRDTWFKDLVLFHNRNMHVWGGPQVFWRGPMHHESPGRFASPCDTEHAGTRGRAGVETGGREPAGSGRGPWGRSVRGGAVGRLGAASPTAVARLPFAEH